MVNAQKHGVFYLYLDLIYLIFELVVCSREWELQNGLKQVEYCNTTEGIRSVRFSYDNYEHKSLFLFGNASLKSVKRVFPNETDKCITML